MYNIAICDDTAKDVERLKSIILNTWNGDDGDLVFHTFETGEELINAADEGISIDLLILDMQMPGMDGDTTASLFRKRYPDAVMAFCSGVHFPTVKSFESNAYRFLLKAYDDIRLAQEMKPILDEMKRQANIPIIPISFKSEVSLVRVDEILYVAGRKYGSSVYLIDRETKESRELLANKSADDIFSEVKDSYFAYPHNSYFVNLLYVVKIMNHEVELADGTKLSMSRSKEKDFRAKLTAFLGNKY